MNVLKTIPSNLNTGVFEDAEMVAITDPSPNLAEFDQFRVTTTKELPPHEHVIKFGHSTVAKAGNIVGISGETKNGKTAGVNILLAKTFGFDGYYEIQVADPCGKAVIGIDTEQDEDDQQYNLRTLEKMLDRKLPDNFCAFNFRKMDLSQYKANTRKIFQACAAQFGGVHLAVIDGGADYMVNGANDERESVELLDFFVKLAIEFNCAILIVVHLNENATRTGNDTMRGHFGKYVSRKAYGQINVTKKDEVSTMQVLRGRRAGADTPTISYRYSQAHGYHIEVNNEQVLNEKQEAKDQQKRAQMKQDAFSAVGAVDALRYTDLVKAIMKKHAIKERAAKDRICMYEAYDYILKGNDGLYRRAKND